MILRQSERKKVKMKMALQAPAGGGKTYSALLLANGLAGGDYSKVAIIDTESNSADLYAHLGNYKVLGLQRPFSPERYIDAITQCEKAGMEVIILDSITHCWEFLLQYHSSLKGNSFTNWGKVTPRHNGFIDKILQSNCHIIATIRTKQGHVLNQVEGKYVPEKIGLKAVQRDGVDYEFTVVFDIDIKHFAKVSKDRTGLFNGKPEFVINSTTGKKLLHWCAEVPLVDKNIDKYINDCLSVSELMDLFKKHPEFQYSHQSQFMRKKSQLEELVNTKNFSRNGNSINQ